MSSSRRRAPVQQILVGLHRVGVAGLHEALVEAEAAEPEDEEARLEVAMAALEQLNYIPAQALADYRRAILREGRRRRGEDLRELFSPIEVEVRGGEGEAMEAFLAAVEAAFAHFELRPVVHRRNAEEGEPQLWIDGDLVARAPIGRRALADAVGRRISDW